MNSGSRPVKVASAAAVLVWLTACGWVVRGYVWPTLSNVEVATLEAMLDPSLFRHDFAVQASLGFSPRFYWNELILAVARLGVPLWASFVLWHLVALSALLGAWVAISRELKLDSVAAAVFGAWVFCSNIGAIAGVYFYTHAPVPAVWAGAAVAWGAIFALRQNAIAAYAAFGIAALLQFLVGFYAGLLALPLLIGLPRRSCFIAVAIWILALAAVYLPMRVSGGTGSIALAGPQFVEIYARLRLPHHLVPSTWGWPAWIQFGLFYVGACVYVVRTSAIASAAERRVLWTALALVVVLLTLNYFFVEVFPVAFVAKLQPARITPLAALIMFGFLAQRLQSALVARRWIEVIALSSFPLSVIPGALLLVAAILLHDRRRPSERVPRWALAIVALTIVFGLRPLDGTLGARLYHDLPWFGVAVALALPYLLRKSVTALVAAAVFATAGAVAAAYLSTRSELPSPLAPRFAVDARPQPEDAPGALGLRFKRRSAPDDVVLVPPAGESWTFKLFSQRADVVDDKNMPFTDAGILEWRRRLDEVLGVTVTPSTDFEACWRQRSPETLRQIATKYRAHYILTRDEWHPTMPGIAVDHEQGWTLWELP